MSLTKIRNLIMIAVCSLLGVNTIALPLVPYVQSTEIQQSQAFTHDYLLTLDTLKKINGQWRSEREQRVSGQLSRSTRQLDAGHSVDEVFDYYRQQLFQMEGREVFSCQARRCGSSNSWANNRFKIRELYGLDQHQRYSVFTIPADEGSVFVSVYGVLRGNKRAYIHVEILESPERLTLYSDDAAIESQLLSQQALLVSPVNDEGLSREQLEALVVVLKRRRQWQLAIVGVDRDPALLSQQRLNSLNVASTIKAQLVGAGIDEGRLVSEGIGGLLPASLGIGGQKSVVLSRVLLSSE
ncbi:MAG: DUF4892 domain-containing protein [Cellvibrionaceae bacterium]|nr:DUF4892 domain-containing protein [Cellvibrionaceae bacterium]|tara:strand:- start:171214 stop:172104 length:891 start_codon:yes stop_codon:yes gene_type:complete